MDLHTCPALGAVPGAAWSQRGAPPPGYVWRRAFGLLLAFAAVTIAGCASLPSDVPRPPSQALIDVSGTRLARIAGAATPADKWHLSGFRILPNGDYALNARIALARRAEKTLDVQYYLIQHDDIGLQFLRELRDAALRGVRVRLLIDDLYAAGDTELLNGLAAYQNVEVRLFNPLPVRNASLTTRVLFSLHQFGRINHRMHNKLFVADNAFAVTGGRNMAAEYFMRNEKANFIDMDVLATGPVVRELSSVFDQYWNSEHVYPVASVSPPRATPAEARERFDVAAAAAAPDMPVAPKDALGRSPVEQQLESGALDQRFAPAQVYADTPDKVAGVLNETLDGTVSTSARVLMRSAHSEVVIASPYFVPGKRGIALMKEAAEHNVRLVLLTNALGASDEPLVHWGYARYRQQMLELGATIYELSPTLSRRSGKLGDFRSSFGRLHAKVAVIDHRWAFIGSLNMDGRSARSNTEMGVVVDSPELADDLMRLLRNDRFASAYRLRLGAGSKGIEWIESDGDAEIVHTDEPDADWLLRVRMWLVSPFVSESML